MTNINKLAEEYAEKFRLINEQNGWYAQKVSDFIAGYKAATQWHPMEEAPKDNHILIVDKSGVKRIGYWGSIQERWFKFEGYDIIHNPIAWTHLPIYNPQNKDK